MATEWKILCFVGKNGRKKKKGGKEEAVVNNPEQRCGLRSGGSGGGRVSKFWTHDPSKHK